MSLAELDPGLAPAAAVDELPRTRRFGLLGRLAQRPSGLFGLVAVAALLLVAVFCGVLAPHDPDALNIAERFQGPSAEHLLGTDGIGRDVLSRCLYGTRTTFGIVLPAIAIGFLAGSVLGLAAGYLGGVVESVLLVLLDAIATFPAVILGFALIALLGPSRTNTIALIAIALVPGKARFVRAMTLAEKSKEYVEGERALGAGGRRIVFLHIFPNLLGPLAVLLALSVPTAIGIEAGLSFLGLGVQPPTADWGVMLADGLPRIHVNAWEVIGPLAFLAVATMGFTFLGEALRDVFDPRGADVADVA